MRPILYLLISFLFCGSVQRVHAASLDGTVLDQTGQPVVGATAYLLQSGVHEHTDALGRFRFEDAPTGDTLAVQAVGFGTYQAAVADLEANIYLALEPLSVDLSFITITPDRDAAAEVMRTDLASRPATSSQELLRSVPGLVIGQHAGGGKAEQLFLRGFDIDHGTDVAIAVDGMPVNMVSHAHGQGYADLHFVIPETVERVVYEKGPYDATAGNFATAASIEFQTKRSLDESLAQLEAGAFGYRRGLAMINLFDGPAANGYGAVEWLQNDGPFVSPQNLRRINAFAKTSFSLPNQSQLTFTGSHFTSSWTASGQIPQRAVESGLIGRFGAIDDTEGGTTGRSNLQAKLVKPLGDEGVLTAALYGSRYDFELFSNFTFFLEDPINGDQIRQQEVRFLGGGEVSYADHLDLGNQAIHLTSGIGSRNDATRDSRLSRTLNRTEVLENIQLGDIREYNQYVYTEAAWHQGPLGITIGGRLDHTTFQYVDQLENSGTLTEDAWSLNPKVKLTYLAGESVQVFAKAGSGYHANDARLVAGNGTRIFMPKAYGSDLGATWKPSPRTAITAAAWGLWSAQEFVYVGDAGIVDPSGRSRRLGFDLSARASLLKSLYAGGDVNLTIARSAEDATGNNYIPLAPPMTASAFVLLQQEAGWIGSVRFRALGDRPANEDYSITARGYQLLDLTAGYRWRCLSLEAILDNALDVDWNETQFATTSRLANEANPTEEIHFTPGAPRNLRVKLGFRF